MELGDSHEAYPISFGRALYSEEKEEIQRGSPGDEQKNGHTYEQRDIEREHPTDPRLVDRDRDRDRESRSRRDRSRSRESDRERSSRRDRDRDYRSKSDRDRDRDRRDRDRRDRDRRDRDRRDRRGRSDRDRDRYRSDRERDRKRRRSRSETPERRILLSSRQKSSLWDKAPPGYETVSAMQFKELMANGQVSGTSNIPRNFDPSQLPPNHPMRNMTHAANLSGRSGYLDFQQGQLYAPGMGPAPGNVGLVGGNTQKQARKIYVGDIPYGITDMEIMDFFNDTMHNAKLALEPGNPVLSASVHQEKNFSFLEMRSIDEATNCLAFDGIKWRNKILKLRRPKDFQPVPGHDSRPPSVYVPGVVSTIVQDSENKLFVGGIPNYLTADQVQELLQPFGTLKSFNLVKGKFIYCKLEQFCSFVC